MILLIVDENRDELARNEHAHMCPALGQTVWINHQRYIVVSQPEWDVNTVTEDFDASKTKDAKMTVIVEVSELTE